MWLFDKEWWKKRILIRHMFPEPVPPPKIIKKTFKIPDDCMGEFLMLYDASADGRHYSGYRLWNFVETKLLPAEDVGLFKLTIKQINKSNYYIEGVQTEELIAEALERAK